MSCPKSNPVGCRIGIQIGCRSDDKTRQIICFEFTQWVGHWVMKGSSGDAQKCLLAKNLKYSGLQNCQSKFLCRVDSAFICLGTTRAKAGADGFVKVEITLFPQECLKTRSTTTMWSNLQNCSTILAAPTFTWCQARFVWNRQVPPNYTHVTIWCQLP